MRTSHPHLNSESPLFTDPRIADQIAFMQELPPRPAVFGVPRAPFHKSIDQSLKKLGIENLFTHQAQAYDAAMSGRDLMVVTGTSSGKTLCYNLPALQICLSEPAAKCLYLFPTKALAQDQLGRL